MSKIGNNPVVIDPEVKITLHEQQIHLQGPKGEIKLNLPKEIKISLKENLAILENLHTTKRTMALHGLFRMLLANAVYGVKNLWTKTLEIHGVGFRVKQEAENLVFQIGYSHPVTFAVPQPLIATVKGNKITIAGVDKQLVGEVAATIKRIRKPDKYKGKGIRYEGEIIKLKPGKKARTTA